MRSTTLFAIGALTLAAACGTTPTERGVTGAGIGAAGGAAAGAVAGEPLTGALLGGAAGGATGALTDPDDVYLGDAPNL